MEKLLSHFLGKGIPAAEIAQIADSFHLHKIAKGDFFIREGSTSKWLAFITKGFFQYFYLIDGKEITTYVTGENTFLASLSSFYKQRPSRENVRALADAELWRIHFDDLSNLKKQSEAFRIFYIRAMEDLVVGMDETRSNLITLSAEERYALLIREEAELVLQIPLQYLASILGITPRHLSRIRGKR